MNLTFSHRLPQQYVKICNNFISPAVDSSVCTDVCVCVCVCVIVFQFWKDGSSLTCWRLVSFGCSHSEEMCDSAPLRPSSLPSVLVEGCVCVCVCVCACVCVHVCTQALI